VRECHCALSTRRPQLELVWHGLPKDIGGGHRCRRRYSRKLPKCTIGIVAISAQNGEVPSGTDLEPEPFKIARGLIEIAHHDSDMLKARRAEVPVAAVLHSRQLQPRLPSNCKSALKHPHATVWPRHNKHGDRSARSGQFAPEHDNGNKQRGRAVSAESGQIRPSTRGDRWRARCLTVCPSLRFSARRRRVIAGGCRMA